MSNGKWDNARTGSGLSGDKTPLPPRKYGNALKAELAVLDVIADRDTGKIGKPTKHNDKPTTLIRYGLLIGSAGDVNGTAFWNPQVDKAWRDETVLAVAFNKPDVVTPERFAEAKAYLVSEVRARMDADNVSAETRQEEGQKRYKNLLAQIRIAVGEIWHLLDWAGRPREDFSKVDTVTLLQELVGTEFPGVIEKSNRGEGSELKSIIKRKKQVNGTGSVVGSANAQIAQDAPQAAAEGLDEDPIPF